MRRLLFVVATVACLVYFFGQPRLFLPGRLSSALVVPDSLPTEDVLNRVSRLYEQQAEIVRAQARGNSPRVEALLERSMRELGDLLRHPGMMEHPRFRELYRSLLTEYEQYYGTFAADTLALQRGDIYEFREAAFEVLNELEEPLLEDVSGLALPPVSTTIPMTVNRLVERSITYLVRSPERHVNQWLSRSETYFPMIEQVLAEEGMPDELKYLALIESGLSPRARSWVNAAGMWQFMHATGVQYGLAVTPWVDERLDPEKSTRAAARYLKALHRQFGDWHLALAAYNCGPGNVQRAIRRSGRANPTFWNIYEHLPRETRNYVPMFIAASLVVSSPHVFGIEVPAPGPRYAYDYVPVQGSPSLERLARAAGTDEATLRALNPELRRSTLPPSAEPYYVRLPVGSYEHFAAQYAELPEPQKHEAQQYVVRRGDTLNRIARQYGVSVKELKRANSLRLSRLRPGQRLTIPFQGAQRSEPRVTLADAAPQRVSYGLRALRPLALANPLQTDPATAVVPSGPAPSGAPAAKAAPSATTPPASVPAAAAPAVSAPALARAEPPREAAPAPQTPAAKAPAPKAQTAAKEAAVQQAAAKPAARKQVRYRVRRGDTLGKIARHHGVTVASVKRWNNLRGSRIQAGQVLTIHGNASGAAASAAQRYVTYRVRHGDTLHRIAQRHGVSVSRIKRWNGLRSSTIHPGQSLRIYA